MSPNDSKKLYALRVHKQLRTPNLITDLSMVLLKNHRTRYMKVIKVMGGEVTNSFDIILADCPEVGPEGGAHAQRQERARPLQVRRGPQGVDRRDGRARAAAARGGAREAAGRRRWQRRWRRREEGQRHHGRIVLRRQCRRRASAALPRKADGDDVDGIEAARGIQASPLREQVQVTLLRYELAFHERSLTFIH